MRLRHADVRAAIDRLHERGVCHDYVTRPRPDGTVHLAITVRVGKRVYHTRTSDRDYLSHWVDTKLMD